MRILMVCVFSNHFFNWVLQLKDSNHEIYWFDVYDSNTYVKRIDFVHQTVKWKRRLDYPGRERLKKQFPSLDEKLRSLNERNFKKFFQKKFDEIKPDIVHSFDMHSAAIPILQIMNKNPKIKWIYSAVGSDLFYYQNDPFKEKGIKEVLNRLDYMFADCNRDYLIAKENGFNGEYLGTFPGGGGYDMQAYLSDIQEFSNRKTILIKGYQNKFGRCINVLEAILRLEDQLKKYKIIVFGANEEVLGFVKKSKLNKMKNLQIKGAVGRGEVIELMGESVIYIGNSISDGLPNTLFEAIIMGAFPIQSNPGGATAEIIQNGKTGFLIENPENSEEIKKLIQKAINDQELIKRGIDFNLQNVKPKLERESIKKQVLEQYKLIESELNRQQL